MWEEFFAAAQFERSHASSLAGAQSGPLGMLGLVGVLIESPWLGHFQT
jgi:hypothetical protein